MATCTRCCLNQAMRIVNMIMTLCGMAMIVYSLWLLKKWDVGVSQLPTVSYLPRPWFIYTCLCVGIAVCLSTLCGQTVANCVSNSTLCIYIVSISSLLLLEVAVIVTVFFKMNWSAQIAEYIDEYHQKFKSFVIFHVMISRLILLMILVPQINVIVLAVILWAIGTEPTHSHISDTPHFTQSFLVGSISDLPDLATQTCSKCDSFCGSNSGRSFLSYTRRVFRMQWQRRVTLN